MRWDLIDRFEVLKKGQTAKAVKTFPGTEDFFKENYPGKPRVPEVFYIEMIAQVGGVLFGLGFDFKKEVILAKILKASFFEWPAPPCEFTVEAWLDKEREDGAWISGKVFSNGKLAAEAHILLVTMTSESMGQTKKIVFNEGFLKHYDVFNVAKKSEVLI